jgi:hypothetical protein
MTRKTGPATRDILTKGTRQTDQERGTVFPEKQTDMTRKGEALPEEQKDMTREGKAFPEDQTDRTGERNSLTI